MEKNDEALALPNARILSAVYFGVLSILATIVIDILLYIAGIGELIPTFKAVLLATIIAAIFGALFGEKIIHCKKPYNFSAFKWGFLMVLLALPLYDLGFLWLIQEHHAQNFSGASLLNWLLVYGILLLYSFIFAGLWLAIIAGFAAMYLRGHLVYDIMHSDKNEDTLVNRTKKNSEKK